MRTQRLRKVRVFIRATATLLLVFCLLVTSADAGEPKNTEGAGGRRSCLWLLSTVASVALVGGFFLGREHPRTSIEAGQTPAALKRALKEQGLELQNELTVNFLPQTHWANNPTKEEQERIGDSQYQILKRIQSANGKCFVFSEGVITSAGKQVELTPELRRNALQKAFVAGEQPDDITRMIQTATTAFPHGMPAGGWRTWTEPQQMLLKQMGAAELLWALGELERVHVADEDKLLEQQLRYFVLSKHDSSAHKEYLFYKARRDIFALSQIVRERGGARESEDPIFLIYGAQHAFEDYQLPNLRIKRVQP